MADWIPKFFPWNKDQPSHHTNGSSKKEEKGNKPFKCFIELTGKTLNSHNHLMDRLKRKIPDLQVVQTEAECDIILVFCPFVRTADRDIKAALERLNDISGTKPAVLVVLHHTFDTEHVASDSSRAVSRGNTITVDCLFYEDSGLLTCQKNEESLDRIVKHINLQIQRIKSVGGRTEIGRYRGQTAYTDYHSVTPKQKSLVKSAEIGQPHWSSSPHSADSAAHCNYPRNKQEMMNKEQRKRKNPEQAEKTTLKYFTLLAGRTLNTHETFIGRLKQEIPQLQQVSIVDECDFILAFCPVVSRAGTDIQAALKQLRQESAIKPAVLVVLHRTFDPDCVVPDSSRAVHRENTITVDCLFYDHQGLLQCPKNHESFHRILNYINEQICPKLITEEERKTEKNPMQPGSCSLQGTPDKEQAPGQAEKTRLKYFILLTGQTLNTHETLMSKLEHEIPQLQQVCTVVECDFILAFCPIVSRAGTDIQSGLRKLHQESANKPAVLVVLHCTFNSEYVAPDSSRAIQRENTLTVDCLFYEQAILLCQKNQESFKKIINYIKQIFPVLSKEVNMETQESHELVVAAKKPCKYFAFSGENSSGSYKALMDRLQKMPDIQEVKSKDKCDFILTICNDVLQDELKKLEAEDHESIHSSKNHAIKLDTETCEDMEAQEAGGSSQYNEKQENRTMEPEQCKVDLDMQREKMRIIEQMNTELKEAKAELASTEKNLQQKKEELKFVSKLLNEGIDVVKMSKSQLNSVGKKMEEKQKQIHDYTHPEDNQSLSNSDVFHI